MSSIFANICYNRVMEFKDRFYELRKERGIGQNKLSDELGVSNAVISYWETGRNEPTLQLLKKICIYFGVSADYLIGLSDD